MPEKSLFARFSKVDDDKRIVGGVFTSEAVDSQREVVDHEAAKAAVADWSAWSNIRAMHQPIAAGVASFIATDDIARSHYLEAKIVDEQEWRKVKEGVYKGFSIGGSVLSQVKQVASDGTPVNRITGLVINEVSLVDKPANPEATFSLVKRDDSEEPVTQTVPAAVSPSAVQKAFAGRLGPDGITARLALNPMVKSAGVLYDEYGYPVMITTQEPPAITQDTMDVRSALWVINDLTYLLNSEAEGPVDAESMTNIRSALDALMRYVEGKLDSAVATAGALDAIEAAASVTDLAKVAGDLGTIAKAGARHSTDDVKMIQDIHDLAIKLGCDCAATGKAADSGTTVQKHADGVMEAGLTENMQPVAEPVAKASFDVEQMAKAIGLDAITTTLQKVADGLTGIEQRMGSLDERLTQLEREPEPGIVTKAVVFPTEKTPLAITRTVESADLQLLKRAADEVTDPGLRQEIGRQVALKEMQSIFGSRGN